MGVVEKKGEGALSAMPTDGRNDLGCGPFMDDDEIGTVQRTVEIILPRIGIPTERRETAREIRFCTGRSRAEIGATPAILGLPCDALVSACNQLGQHAPEEMRIAMIPVRDQRMGEPGDPHQAGTSTGRLAARA